jgi:putative hemolysin
MNVDPLPWSMAAVLLVLGAVMGGIEAALMALPEARLRAMRDELGDDKGARLQRYLDDPSRTLSRLLAGRVLGPILATALVTHAVDTPAGPAWVAVATVGAVAAVYGLLSEVVVTACRMRARSIALVALGWIRPLTWALSPFAAVLAAAGRWTARRMDARGQDVGASVTEKEVEYVVEAAQRSGAVDEDSRSMVENIFELKGRTARELMVPRMKMVILDAETSLDEAVQVLREEGHSRVPVYREQSDNVVGVLVAKDLFRVATNGWRDRDGTVVRRLEDLVRRPVFFVSENQAALSVLRDMQARRMHLAVVVDHHGSVRGLVTLEDVLEELVGDIEDEHDHEEDSAAHDLVPLADNRWLASAAIAITDLGDRLSVRFPDDGEYASLGGFLAARAGKVPEVGTVVLWSGLRFVVREGDKRRATKVEIVRDESRRDTSPAPSAS